MKRRRTEDLLAQLLPLVARQDGVSNAEVREALSVSESHAGNLLGMLKKAGQAVWRAVPLTGHHKGNVVRWFAGSEPADAWAAAGKAETQRKSSARRVNPGPPGARLVVKGGTVTPPAPPMPKPAAAPIITAATKITRDTTKRPTARWQMQQQVSDQRWPSFSATPPGFNPDTGRPWA